MDSHMNVKNFYLKHYEMKPSEVFDVDAAARTMRTPGQRYFAICDSIGKLNELSALEWGFGSVSMAIALSREFKSYHAIDIAASSLLRDHDVTFEYSDHDLNSDLPFPDNCFDVSIAMAVIEHLFDPFHSFREISRTTKPDGFVIITLPLLTSIRNRLSLLFGRVPVTSVSTWWEFEEWDGGHLHYFSIELVKKLGAKYGLAMLDLYPVGKHLWLKKLSPEIFCHVACFVFRKLPQ